MTRGVRRLAWMMMVLAVTAALTGLSLRGGAPALTFAERIGALSEAPGYFDTDNLISNESSYLHVMPALEERGITGGVYIGVGPDQNFSYIAKIRPAVAYLVDIRRDNLLLHLLFKALFELSPARIDYVSRLTGRALPPEKLHSRDLALPEVMQWVDKAPLADRAALRSEVEGRLRTYGVALSPQDLDRIARFHGEFIADGLNLQFHSHGRPPNDFYPTLRQLLMATDRTGRRWSYLDSEAAYAYLRGLQARNGIVPVVGDLSGSRALAAIAAEMRNERTALSAIYVSNVEDYLFRSRRFANWVGNLAALPHTANAVVIRAVFGGGPSTSETQGVDDLTHGIEAGRYRSYWDVIYRSR